MKKILFFLATWICMAFSCNPEETDTYHRTVKVTNNAGYPVYVTWDWVEQYDNPEESLKYPWNSTGNKVGEWNNRDRISPGGTNNSSIDTGRPNNSIEGLMRVYKHMKVFFVDATAYDQIPIGSPIPNEVLLDSRVYDLEALRAINFHIHYPLPEE